MVAQLMAVRQQPVKFGGIVVSRFHFHFPLLWVKRSARSRRHIPFRSLLPEGLVDYWGDVDFSALGVGV
jgi:hypothetical protein